MPATISNRTARRAFLALQGLSDAPHKGQSKDDLLELIRRIGTAEIPQESQARLRDLLA